MTGSEGGGEQGRWRRGGGLRATVVSVTLPGTDTRAACKVPDYLATGSGGADPTRPSLQGPLRSSGSHLHELIPPELTQKVFVGCLALHIGACRTGHRCAGRCRLADSGLVADALVSVPSCVCVDAPGLGGQGSSGLSDLHFTVRARTP